MKLLSVASCFFAGAIGVTLVGWVLSLAPFFLRAIIYSGALFIIGYGLLWWFDDPLSQYLSLSLPHYYAIVIALGVSVVMGIVVLVGVLNV